LQLYPNTGGSIGAPTNPSVKNEAIEKYNALLREAKKLKKEKKAIIMAHNYQRKEVQEIADYLGDSLELARQATKVKAEIIVFAGVYFMAETAKILNPERVVLIPEEEATCAMAKMVDIVELKKLKKQYPDAAVVSYINTTAETKTYTDIVCTSANAVKIVNSLPNKRIIFLPDKNLGGYINSITGRKMVLWDGACIVHEQYSVEKIANLMDEHIDAEFIAHPECEKPVLLLAKHIGSTTSLLNYVQSSSSKKFIVATEPGILHQMVKACPDKIFIPAPSIDSTCGCNDCEYMKLNSLQKLYICMKYEQPEVLLPADVIEKAQIPIQRMLDISK